MKEVANFANDKTDRLRETANKGGEGVQNPENFANVINGCPLTCVTEFSKVLFARPCMREIFVSR